MSVPRLSPLALCTIAGVLLSSLAGCGDLAQRPAVRLGDRALSVGDLRTAYADLDPSGRPSLATREDRHAFARRIVDRMILVEFGRQLEPDAAAAALRPDVSLLLLRRLRVIEGGGAGIDSATYASAWARMSVRRRVQVAFFPREEEAVAARRRLDEGAPFDSVVAGDGRSTAARTRWVVWSPAPEPVADAVAESGPGEIAGPVGVGGGWLLVRVLERETIDPGSPEEARARVLQGLRIRREVEAVEALARRLRAEAAVRIEGSAVGLLTDRTRSAILRPGATEQDEDWAVPLLSAAEESMAVATWQGGRIDAGEYVRQVADEIRSQRPRLALETEVRRKVEQMVTSRLLLAEAERRRLREDWWVERAIRRMEEERAIQRAIREIEKGFAAPSMPDSLAEALHAAQPELFRVDARVRLLRFDVPSRAEGEAELERIRHAGGPEARLRELLEGERAVIPTYHLFWVTRGELPSLRIFDELYDGGPGVVAGPHPVGDVWAVFACLEKTPPSQPTREEILARLRNQTSVGSDPRRIAAWIDERLQARGLVIDDDVLDELAPGG